ncbi:MAG: penicillin-binding transpeptidase domain-containing protein [Chthoniobacterales bacterium]
MKPQTYFSTFFFLWALFCLTPLFASEVAFLAQENDTVLCQEGDISTPYAAYSSLKIAISVMGYDDGILLDETHPAVSYQKTDQGHYDWLSLIFKQLYDPKAWMEHEHMSCSFSVAWYSEWVLQQLGLKKFQEYLTSFHYGDQNHLEYSEEKDGSMFLWFKKSLKISTQEQVVFLQKLLAYKLPASPRAQEMTQKILYIEEFSNGWKLYGKSCSGPHGTCLGPHGTWFVGWIEHGARKIIFAYHAFDPEHSFIPATMRAKEAVKEKLQMMIFSMK